jgi:DMSO/TMAO reductase YedYZ molybdopterin-dependent catalytic subunit
VIALRAAVLALASMMAMLTASHAQSPMPAPAPSPFHVTLDAGALAGLPRVTLSATDEGGHTDSYTGVSLRDLLTKLGAPAGAPVRGKAMTSYVIVGASDGYHVLFTLPELDASYTDHVVLIAESKDGAPLTADAGPYRLVVPFEKRQARWVKHVTEIGLANAPIP